MWMYSWTSLFLPNPMKQKQCNGCVYDQQISPNKNTNYDEHPFICTGNVSRSAVAECILRTLAERAGRDDIAVASAGGNVANRKIVLLGYSK